MHPDMPGRHRGRPPPADSAACLPEQLPPTETAGKVPASLSWGFPRRLDRNRSFSPAWCRQRDPPDAGRNYGETAGFFFYSKPVFIMPKIGVWSGRVAASPVPHSPVPCERRASSSVTSQRHPTNPDFGRCCRCCLCSKPPPLFAVSNPTHIFFGSDPSFGVPRCWHCPGPCAVTPRCLPSSGNGKFL